MILKEKLMYMYTRKRNINILIELHVLHKLQVEITYINKDKYFSIHQCITLICTCTPVYAYTHTDEFGY